MSKPQVYDAFGSVPATVPPSVKVRYWHEALLLGPLVFLVLYYGLAWLTYNPPFAPADLEGYWAYLANHGLLTALHYLMGGYALDEPARIFWAEVRPYHLAGIMRALAPLLIASGIAGWLTAILLRPRSNVRHLAGPRLLDGKEALAEARRRSMSPKLAATNAGNLAIHPAWVMSKKLWARHVFGYGSVGSGKTQWLLGVVQQILERNQKLFLFDVKGDFTSFFKKPIILCPFDARSYVWDIAKDVRTPSQAAAFAASIIPEDSSGSGGKFWTTGAQQLTAGVIRGLQNEKGTEWTWADLARGCAQGAPGMLEEMKKHYPKAAPLVENTEGQTTASLLATLSSYTRVIDDLALAWPRIGKRRFSITDWVSDDYQGRKQVIVQSGPDPQLTRAYIAAMVNAAVEEINSPSLPDNEEGRFIGFILDELPSLGKIQIGPLIAKGRSKGVVLIGLVQDLSQLKQVYGEHEAKTMSSIVGTHLIFQVQMGETRRELAALLGKKKVSVIPHGEKPVAREEGKDVLHADDLTNRLGFAKGKQFGPNGWGIRAIVVSSSFKDPLLLDFPGLQLSKVRDGQIAAKWTMRPGGINPGYTAPTPLERKPTVEEQMATARVLKRGLTEEEIQRMLS